MRKMSSTIKNRQLVKKCKEGQNGIEGNEFQNDKKCENAKKTAKIILFADYKMLKMRKMSLNIKNRQLVKKCKVRQNGIDGNGFF